MSDLQPFYDFLDELKEKEITSIYGAPDCLVEEFDCTLEQAKDIVQLWLDNAKKGAAERGKELQWINKQPPEVQKKLAIENGYGGLLGIEEKE